MKCPEVIYQEVNKSKLIDYFNKIPGERKSYKRYRKQTKKAIRGIRGKPGKKRSSRIDVKALVFRWLDISSLLYKGFREIER